MVSKNILLNGLNQFHGAPTPPSFQKGHIIFTIWNITQRRYPFYIFVCLQMLLAALI